MINSKVLIRYIMIAGVSILFQTCNTRTYPERDKLNAPTVLSGLHTLSIHIRDTLTHDSVFHFLVEKLKLPVYYHPHMLGPYRYAGVYTGNIVLEPCGPYTSFRYATDDFRAIFFGLTFNTKNSLAQSATDLSQRGIQIRKSGGYISVNDTLFTGENLYISMRETKPEHKKIFDSLQYSMSEYSENGPGIERVKEIRIRYNTNAGLDKWKAIIEPETLKNKSWRKGNDPEFTFTEGRIKEVQGIVFKVRSLDQCRNYIVKNNLAGKITSRKIELDRSKAFGLYISFEE